MVKNPLYGHVLATAGPHIQSIIKRWLPHGDSSFGSYKVISTVVGRVKRSGNVRINLSTGEWHNATDGASGRDIITLLAYLERISLASALNKLASMLLEGFGNGKY